MTVHTVPVWQRAVVILSGAVVGMISILALQWGRPVLIPIALAVLLTFLLNPIVKYLYRRGLNQILSVMIAVTAAGLIVMCLGWVVTEQVSGMLAKLPENTARIKAKVKTLKELGSGQTKVRIGQMIEEISAEIYPTADDAKNAVANGPPQDHVEVEPGAGAILVRPATNSWNLTGYVGSAFEVLATLAFSLVLLVFFLIEREDLRDRVVLLAGRAKLATTSKALEDITDRVSRYIGMVALVNGGFGLVLTIGLLVMGVPYALLWGLIAATFRFIPYIGPWIGAVFPITMSLALSDGWGQPIAVFAFVAVVELTTNNIVEPLLFGRTIGVSPTALLVSAAFWLYLWGPVGLVLSAPFAVCLVVMGRHIPQLGFLYLLLGDKPALNQDSSFYQRLMLGDFHEAAAVALRRIKDSPSDDVYDQMLIPVLNYTRRDIQREYLTEEDQQSVLEGMRMTLAKIEESRIDSKERTMEIDDAKTGQTVDASSLPSPLRILGCPATDDADRIALEMLQQLLDPTHWQLEIESLETLTSELIASIRKAPPAFVFIASIPPGGLAHSRYLCKRLRKACPELSIIVGRCGQKRNARNDREQLESAGASFVIPSLLEARNLLNARRPLLEHQGAAVASTETQEALNSASRRLAVKC